MTPPSPSPSSSELLPELLPELRQDLALYAAPPAPDGSPCWHLHDPAANKFYQIGWVAFEVLSRWRLASATQIAEAVATETTLEIDTDTVKSVADFLERHNLFAATAVRDTTRLERARAAGRLHWAKWLLHNYLFFRIPLLRPDVWLGRRVWLIRPLLTPAFWIGLGLFALAALGLVARQWEQFLHGFAAYTGWQTLLAFGLAMTLAKMGHELGHAFVAKHHGCKVPTMGVAFLVLWPVLYTDTNEAWKLPANRARFQIAIAGMATELGIAVCATWAWLLLPEGPVRAAAFFVATTSWLMTLALNASPFMRFDGYFLLVDTLGMPNLHARAFAMGRWWLRERLFGLGEPAPEMLSPRRSRFLIAFAFGTWLYRFVLFLSIALLVYYAFFKALGIVLMLVEVGWFIVRPVVQEIESWWQRRHGMAWNPALRRSVSGLGLLLAWLILPWQGEIAVPAVLAPRHEQTLYAPYAARVVNYPAQQRSTVKQGDVLLELESPDLAHRLHLARITEATLRTRLEQQAFSDKLLEQGEVLMRRWEEAVAETSGLVAQLARLNLRAAMDGEVVLRADDLQPGSWVTEREMLLGVADRSQGRIEVYVGESDLDRLQVNAAARFVPNAPEFGRRDCRVAEIEHVNLVSLDEPALASVYGGPLPSRLDRYGMPIPAEAIYRIMLDRCTPLAAPSFRLHGVTHVEAERRSLLWGWLRHVLAVLIRESGF